MVLAELAIFAASIIALSKAASVTIDNVAKLAAYFNITQVSLGLVLVAMTTTLPELSVSVISGSAGEGAIAAGNVFGSIIANVFLIVGLAALLYGIRITRAEMVEIAITLLTTTVISLYIIFNSAVVQAPLGLMEGLLLLGVFGIHIWHTLRRKHIDADGINGKIEKKGALDAFLRFGTGIILVIICAGFVVEYAVRLSAMLGIAESLIGSTVIAIGTSLPEMSIALQAARKRHYGLVLGNVIGSNMSNLTLVLGVAAVLNPISLAIPVFIAAIIFAILANSVLFYLAAIHKGVGRVGGGAFLIIYALFLLVIALLQMGALGSQNAGPA